MTQREMRAEQKRVVEDKLRTLEEAMKRRQREAEAHQKERRTAR